MVTIGGVPLQVISFLDLTVIFPQFDFRFVAYSCRLLFPLWLSLSHKTRNEHRQNSLREEKIIQKEKSFLLTHTSKDGTWIPQSYHWFLWKLLLFSLALCTHTVLSGKDVALKPTLNSLKTRENILKLTLAYTFIFMNKIFRFHEWHLPYNDEHLSVVFPTLMISNTLCVSSVNSTSIKTFLARIKAFLRKVKYRFRVNKQLLGA